MARKKTASTPKRPPAQRTAAAGPAPRQRGHRSIVTKRDLQAYRKRLEGELAELTGQRRDLEEATGASMSEASGEIGFDEEYADAGSYTFERERDLSLVDNVKDLMEKVQHALARIDEGSYGRCEACDKPIEAERLDALPYTTLCLVDARRRVRPR
jgi:RNA polymerase-binding transcription factor DksA